MKYLLHDQYSVFKKLYGKQGDKVKVISTHGNVSIVENAAGFRFPCKNEALIESKEPVKTI